MIADRRRLAAQPDEIIDRQRPLTFTFDGKPYPAYAGDTIGSALAAAGMDLLSRSFKYHRPRGLLCCAGHCPNCLVQVGPEPNVRACTRPVEPGMSVTSQNAWPSLERDALSLMGLAGRFTPVGFYYKAFVHPQALWPAYEKVLRRAAGLGSVQYAVDQYSVDQRSYEQQYVHADVAVVGGGPAGLSAALAAARQGARVLLIDENPALGGHLHYSLPQHREARDELIGAVGQYSVVGEPVVGEPVFSRSVFSESGVEASGLGITVLLNTAAIGAFEENWLAAVSTLPRKQGGSATLYKIRAGAMVYATGAYEQPLVFGNNDRPGIMLGGAVQRLLRLYGVAPGHRAVVVTANDDGWAVAADLLAAGVEVAAVADVRAEVDSEQLTAVSRTVGQWSGARGQQLEALWGHTALSAGGGRRVSNVTLAPLDTSGRVDAARAKTVTCDLVVVSVGWSPANGLLAQAGAPLIFDERRMEFMPDEQGSGEGLERVFAAGRVAGAHELECELTDGRLAGQRAASAAGFGAPPDVLALAAQELSRAAEPSRTSAHILSPGSGKRILCFCEDVTDKDLEMSIAEGYDSIELLKRYSTISMGPCQGKMCSRNTLHLCARANGWTVARTGTTTARPPVTPVSLGALAGRRMEPVRVTPVHEWHRANGAKLMIAGLWLRPEHYGDPLAEARAVRQGVGLIDVSTLGKFRLVGPGVPALLDRLYINRWNNLAVGRVHYGVMCNDEGIILDDGVTARVGENEWYMTTTSSGSGAIFEWIQWWLQSGWGEGVCAVNLSEVNAAFNLAGPRSREVLRELTDADLSNETFPYMRTREAAVAGAPCRLLRIGFTGELSYEIHCPAGYGLHVWEALLTAGQAFGIRPFGVEAQRVLRLEKGHLIVGQDTDGLTDPVAADMELTVKLDKPDFLGQRAITRVMRDGARQRLVGFKMAASGVVPDEGLQIVRPGTGDWPEIIGWITSCRFSPTLNETIGLCWLDAALASRPGAVFTIRMNGRLEEARVHHGPFHDPEGVRLRE